MREMIETDIREVARAMGRETIMISLNDLKDRKTHFQERAEALAWFNERSMAPFGYGWCLEQSGMNPNDIRKGINLYLNLGADGEALKGLKMR